MPQENKKLVNQAEVALSSSYSPYSNFTVGAALRLESGEVIAGSNQENASYPAGLCAERVALFQSGAVHPDKKILTIAVVARRKDTSEYRSAGPCGMCRQVMLEYEHKQNSNIEVIFKLDTERWVKTSSAEVLLPFSFGKDNL